MSIPELGAILFVGAHPDDEVFCAAGLLATAVRNGQRVAVVCATRGEAGIQDETRWPRSELAAIRTREMERSLEILGVEDHAWFEYADGECDQAHGAVGELSAVIDRFKPDTVVTFGPDGLTGHADHKAVCDWTRIASGNRRVLWVALTREQYQAMSRADAAGNIFFSIDRPVLVSDKDLAVDLRLTPELTDLKRRAFEAVESQFERLLSTSPFERPGEGLARECFISGH